MQRSAAEFAIQELPPLTDWGWRSLGDAQHPSANAFGMLGNQLFAEVIDHNPSAQQKGTD